MEVEVVETAAKAELSKKQAQVVLLIQQGKTVPQIAKRMKISNNGVYGHIRKIKDKGAGHLLEVPSSDAPSSGNGSSQNGAPDSAALGRIHAQVKEAIETADERLSEISTRQTEIREQADSLRHEEEALAREGEQIATERGKLAEV